MAGKYVSKWNESHHDDVDGFFLSTYSLKPSTTRQTRYHHHLNILEVTRQHGVKGEWKQQTTI
jgi:hypothetical protein